MKLRLLAFVVSLPLFSFSQVSIDWVVDTRGVSIAVDAADNVYTVDYDYNPAGDIYLTKRDKEGHFQWQSKFDQTDNSKWEEATWVAVDTDGNAIVSGNLMSGYSSPVNAASILMKYSPQGELIWRNVYETSFDGSYTKKCLVDEENNIYVLGMGHGDPGFVTKIKKFAPDGTALWSYFDADGIGAPVNFKFTPDNHMAITGRAIYGSINGYAKIDREGNKIWSFPGVNSLTVGDCDGDDFGNTYLVHGEYVTDGGTELKKVSPSGNLMWSNVFNLSGFRVEVGSDNQPVVCGFPNANNGGASFIKVDGDGNLIWANPDADGDYALLMHAQLIMDRFDNTYLAAGTLFEMAVCKVAVDGSSAWTITMPGSYANAFTLGKDDDVYVVGGSTVKLKQNFVSSLNDNKENVTNTFQLFQNYPNPFNPQTIIRYRIPFAGLVNIEIFDVEGKKVRNLLAQVQLAGEHQVIWDGRDDKANTLPSGLYVSRMLFNKNSRSMRLLLLK